MSLFRTDKPLITIKKKKKHIEIETNLSFEDEIKLTYTEKNIIKFVLLIKNMRNIGNGITKFWI